MKIKWLGLIAGVIVFSTNARAQNDTMVSRLLAEIEQAQIRRDSFYYAGMFPGYRHHGHSNGRAKEDNNIFFTGLIAWTLADLQPHLKGPDSLVCSRIIERTQGAFVHFRNRSGRPTYNFWKTNPGIVFPNSRFLNLFKKWHSLPDDLDDTVISLMAMGAADSTARMAKALMGQHANTVHYRIRNTYRKYRSIPAYSTWFGTKMPIDFDFCVQSNVLYFQYLYGMANGVSDSATVRLLEGMIRSREYMSAPAYISPHYARSPVLIYHIARLMHRFDIPELQQHRGQLVADAKQLLSVADAPMDRVILSTSLLWLGEKTLPPVLKETGRQRRFIFFVAGFHSLLRDPFKEFFTGNRITTYYFRCPAYDQALLLQHLVYAGRYNVNIVTPGSPGVAMAP